MKLCTGKNKAWYGIICVQEGRQSNEQLVRLLDRLLIWVRGAAYAINNTNAQ